LSNERSGLDVENERHRRRYVIDQRTAEREFHISSMNGVQKRIIPSLLIFTISLWDSTRDAWSVKLARQLFASRELKGKLPYHPDRLSLVVKHENEK
jgi:hypothetical protein